MAKSKNPESDQLPSPKSDNSSAEFERRLTALEKATADLNNRIFDSHKWFVTVLFSAVAVVLTVYGVLSRLDVRDSTNEMEKRVATATEDMEKKFEVLAGESLKRPSIELLNESSPLEDALIDIYVRRNMYPKEAILNILFIKNTGDKQTEPLSIRLSFAAPIQLDEGYGPQEWESVSSYETNFPASYYSKRHATVAPGETINIQPIILDGNTFPFLDQLQTNVLCKIQVFYGGEKSVDAQFRIRMLSKN